MRMELILCDGKDERVLCRTTSALTMERMKLLNELTYGRENIILRQALSKRK
jgi:hypothetical protein